MDNTIYKIAQRGEGKTRWLLEQAKNELDHGEEVVLLTNGGFMGIEYKMFSYDYVELYKEVCKVTPINSVQHINSNTIVLIDDLFHIDQHMICIRSIQQRAKRVYITVDGTLEPPVFSDPNQLTILRRLNNE